MSKKNPPPQSDQMKQLLADIAAAEKQGQRLRDQTPDFLARAEKFSDQELRRVLDFLLKRSSAAKTRVRSLDDLLRDTAAQVVGGLVAVLWKDPELGASIARDVERATRNREIDSPHAGEITDVSGHVAELLHPYQAAQPFVHRLKKNFGSLNELTKSAKKNS